MSSEGILLFLGLAWTTLSACSSPPLPATLPQASTHGSAAVDTLQQHPQAHRAQQVAVTPGGVHVQPYYH